MRGKAKAQPEFLTTINLNQRVPAEHPLRGIKARVDQVLVRLSPLFDELYADEGRPSIPPEQLLKGRILMALYSVRSERLFCEQLAYNLLWLWFSGPGTGRSQLRRDRLHPQLRARAFGGGRETLFCGGV
jgi:transposase